MFFKRWFASIEKNESHIKELNEKIRLLETKLEQIETPLEKTPPIIIKTLHVENINIDKYELSNNFGALGVRALYGTLNIGANYGKDSHTKHKTSDESSYTPNYEKKQTMPPKFTIRGRKSE